MTTPLTLVPAPASITDQSPADVSVTTGVSLTRDDGVTGGAPDGQGDGEAHEGPEIRVAGNPDAIRKLRRAPGAGLVPDLYVTGGAPVRIERVSGTLAVDLDDDVPLPVRATPLRPALLANLFAHHTTVLKLAATGGWGEWQPPAEVLGAVLAGSEWPELATLSGIIGTPVLRRDWTLAQTPGYDPGSGLFLAPTVILPPVPERPSPKQVATARAFIVDVLLHDFEWEDAASLANYVGL